MGHDANDVKDVLDSESERQSGIRKGSIFYQQISIVDIVTYIHEFFEILF